MRIIDKPGLAPIRPLLEDPAVTEIMINGPLQVYVERAGRMVEVPGVFAQPSELDLLVDNLVVAAGRGVNARSPMADFRMEDGSRPSTTWSGTAPSRCRWPSSWPARCARA
jgi:pilus assembly protein CpaF